MNSVQLGPDFPPRFPFTYEECEERVHNNSKSQELSIPPLALPGAYGSVPRPEGILNPSSEFWVCYWVLSQSSLPVDLQQKASIVRVSKPPQPSPIDMKEQLPPDG
ncbi:unnamed protein product [Pleuronectes platessa]|uniref:Uncharacterized protein n=1 Tax=Pleuronectes platessa TaxID=8262 RepID=A0A9N7UMF8_PLEPL|nr:unnamed protein product [Pleuronectes platessa]